MIAIIFWRNYVTLRHETLAMIINFYNAEIYV